MKKILTILLLAVSLTAWADKWYVATTGSDSHGKGTLVDPWLTLKHAADTVTGVNFVGDTIVVGVGTFIETSQIVLGEGVSIYGAGETSILVAGAALEPMILMSSTSEGTNGNQSISYLKIDGDLTALFGFSVRRRSNVIFHNITIVDFIYSAIEIYGGSGFASTPTTYASGNVIRNSTIDNCCSRRDPLPFGAIRIGGTIGMEVHDCTLTQISRPATENGNLLYLWGSPNKAFKFYNNICTKPDTDGIISGYAGGWNFHIESGPCSGAEIYNNKFIGGVALDLAGGNQVKGEYDYSWYVHDNEFSISQQIPQQVSGTHPPHGMDFERTCEDVIVARNTFNNYPVAINLTTSSSLYTKSRIYFYYNIFTNLGHSDAYYAYGFQFVGSSSATGLLASDIYLYNNIFHANLGRAHIGFLCPYDLNNIYIRNNIFLNAHVNGWLIVPLYCGDLVTPTGTFTGIYIDNNLMYNNANSNNIRYVDGKTMTIASYANNILGSDPLFKSANDFHLQSSSPARDTGIDVSAITGGRDFNGASLYGSAYDIGVFEYGLNRMIILNDTILPTINYKIPLIDH